MTNPALSHLYSILNIQTQKFNQNMEKLGKNIDAYCEETNAEVNQSLKKQQQLEEENNRLKNQIQQILSTHEAESRVNKTYTESLEEKLKRQEEENKQLCKENQFFQEKEQELQKANETIQALETELAELKSNVQKTNALHKVTAEASKELTKTLQTQMDAFHIQEIVKDLRKAIAPRNEALSFISQKFEEIIARKMPFPNNFGGVLCARRIIFQFYLPTVENLWSTIENIPSHPNIPSTFSSPQVEELKKKLKTSERLLEQVQQGLMSVRNLNSTGANFSIWVSQASLLFECIDKAHSGIKQFLQERGA